MLTIFLYFPRLAVPLAIAIFGLLTFRALRRVLSG